MPMVLGGSGTISSDVITSAANGNVGIGNSSPSTKLSVNGEAFFGRADASVEGGEIKLARSSDNLAHYSIDCYGGSTTPSMRFIDNVVGAVRMSINSSGYINIPYQPAFHARDGAAATSAGNVILFNNIVTNISSSYNASTGRFTCPVAGIYAFFVTYMKDAGNTDTYSTIRRNGTAYASIDCTGSNYTPSALQAVISCVAGDYVDCYVNGGTVYSSYRQFSGYLIG